MSDTLASRYEVIIFDLDGVVYLGSEPVDGASAAIRAVADAGTAVAYATNNASRRAAEVAALLESLGVPARPEEVFTSARAAAQLLAADLEPGASVLVVGAPALVEEIRAVGLTPVDDATHRPVAVVQGYGPEVGYKHLAEANIAIRGGARWVVTNMDATLPSPRGPLPGNGSLVAAVRTSLGGRAPDTVVGKPEPTLVEVAAQGPDGPRHALVVGDRLDTDIECAIRAGMDGLLVLTGVATPEVLLRAAPHERPTYVAADLSSLSTPDARCRVPEWQGIAIDGGWRATAGDGRLTLAGDGTDTDPVGALRALAAAAWAKPEWTGIDAIGDAAAEALPRLGLTQFAGWSVRPASAT
jgi:HAD superfamily hydrolase (TIGR01450 family)